MEQMGRTWRCPYYHWDKGNEMYCEGGNLKFGGRKAWEDYTGQYCTCNPGWRRCTLAQNLERVYERKIGHEKRAKK